jgi:glycosyltransferase involved in cell wall biosynthesis
MKILIYSPTWWPNVGGMEDIGHGLASGLVSMGHSVTVVTPVASSEERQTSYQIVRHPSQKETWELVREHDIIHSNGIAVKLLPLAILQRKPFTWSHQAYQLQSIDGAGWTDGVPAPLTPFRSIAHHYIHRGFVAGTVGGIKLLGRRLCSQLVCANIASSNYVASIQPTPRQIVIHNPYDVGVFGMASLEEAEAELSKASHSFTFVGRLVTEKGVDDLLHAFATLSQTTMPTASLKIIGDGPEMTNLVALAKQLGIAEQTTFCGTKTGRELGEEIRRSGICVLPSAWQEPAGLVALNLMAAGKPLIVSASGGLSESVGDAALTFPNRNRKKLAETMEKLQGDLTLQKELIRRGLQQIQTLRSQDSVAAYAQLFESLVSRNGGAK